MQRSSDCDVTYNKNQFFEILGQLRPNGLKVHLTRKIVRFYDNSSKCVCLLIPVCKKCDHYWNNCTRISKGFNNLGFDELISQLVSWKVFHRVRIFVWNRKSQWPFCPIVVSIWCGMRIHNEEGTKSLIELNLRSFMNESAKYSFNNEI